MRCSISYIACLLPLAVAAPAEKKRQSGPTVSTCSATVVGYTYAGIDSFLGIPYAQPPVGELRLKPPQVIVDDLGTVDATATPLACPQFSTSQDPSSTAGEDCLTINVQRPSTATADSKLPVLFWIYGGGFETGSTSNYDATYLLNTSITRDQSIIYVAANYREGGFGFLGGSEIKADGSSNIGLLDQRLALEWVADNIAFFGGDPDKVTIWGESSGSISVFDQILLYGGDNTYNDKPLFRGAIMDSGSITPTDPVDSAKPQAIYDAVVAAADCSDAADSLECLRAANYTTFLNAANSVPGISSYNSVALSYVPRPDGVVLVDSPEILVANGQYAKVPFIIGDQEDEGTYFALVQTNISTTADLVTYLSTLFFQDATVAQVEALVATYPDNASDGSPFRTGTANEIYPEYKRLAAILGDITFTLTRRILLSIYDPTISTWSYLATYGYGTPYLGTYHGSDVPQAFGTVADVPSVDIQAYYISFVNYLDPNTGTSGFEEWPLWAADEQLLNFEATGTSLLADNFRNESYAFLVENIASLHL